MSVTGLTWKWLSRQPEIKSMDSESREELKKVWKDHFDDEPVALCGPWAFFYNFWGNDLIGTYAPVSIMELIVTAVLRASKEYDLLRRWKYRNNTIARHNYSRKRDKIRAFKANDANALMKLDGWWI